VEDSSGSFNQQAVTSHEADAAPSGHAVPKDSCTAFVSNLDYAVTADQIREIFCEVRTCEQLQKTNNAACGFCLSGLFSANVVVPER